jgi:hypothetical protein
VYDDRTVSSRWRPCGTGLGQPPNSSVSARLSVAQVAGGKPSARHHASVRGRSAVAPRRGHDGGRRATPPCTAECWIIRQGPPKVLSGTAVADHRTVERGRTRARHIHHLTPIVRRRSDRSPRRRCRPAGFRPLGVIGHAVGRGRIAMTVPVPRTTVMRDRPASIASGTGVNFLGIESGTSSRRSTIRRAVSSSRAPEVLPPTPHRATSPPEAHPTAAGDQQDIGRYSRQTRRRLPIAIVLEAVSHATDSLNS